MGIIKKSSSQTEEEQPIEAVSPFLYLISN